MLDGAGSPAFSHRCRTSSTSAVSSMSDHKLRTVRICHFLSNLPSGPNRGHTPKKMFVRSLADLAMCRLMVSFSHFGNSPCVACWPPGRGMPIVRCDTLA